MREEVGGQKLELSDESVAEVLRECEVNINSVMRKIKAGNYSNNNAPASFDAS